VYDQLMDGYPSETDRDAIFKAYVTALNEDPELYRLILTTRLLLSVAHNVYPRDIFS
jgi:hypothetical protein